jgi:hypothetical protein
MPQRITMPFPIFPFIILILVFAAGSHAAEFPAMSVPDNSGVNTGVTARWLDDDDFDKIRRSGATYIRFDLFWDNIETVKGKYDWDEFDRLIAKIKQYGIKPILILDYNNRLYDAESGGIRDDDTRDGFARFAAAAVARYQQTPGVIWEIWNEPNSDGFWKPKKNPDEYMALLKRTVAAMRKVDPAATIINGGVLELSWRVTRAYLDRCFELGLLDLIDGLGVHLYGGRYNTYPERIVRELRDLRQRMAAYGGRPDFPILNTEFGSKLEEYASSSGPTSKDPELGQAETYVRMYLLGLMERLGMTVWYEWRSRQEFSGHAILNSNGTPRPAYMAIANLTAQLSGYAFETRINEFGEDDFVLVFEKGEQRKIVAWTAGATHSISVEVNTPANYLPISGMMGETGSLNAENGAFSIRLTGSPMYFDIGVSMLGERHH